MQKYFLGFILFFSTNSFAQKNYFQQYVNYKIEVSLDDENHILRGFETFDYQNNSNDTLKYIFIHLYPNAYKNDKTAFTEQQVENRITDFYFSKENERGYIDSLQFKVNGNLANTSDYNNHEDVILLELEEWLLPNKSVTISTPFRVQIPGVFSRLGHNEQNYQITQWYPKPAVYDNEGWHPMPYLDQGEFYSEFGKFEVSITLPSNYVVASTGELQTKSEIEFINEKCKEEDSTKSSEDIESETILKTISFVQNNVHDFAWFADKRFQIEKTQATLKDGKTINCFSFFKPENYKYYHNSSKIIETTILYLSEHVGKYPYANACIVDGSLKAGGGMEYPMVTVIAEIHSKSELQTVIVHEVGHNWFQGILGNNERDNPWMDEGINSFYEREIESQISKFDTIQQLKKSEKISKKLNGNFLYLLTAKLNEDQASTIKSTEFTSLNYGADLYTKTAYLFNYLKNYLGEKEFDGCMKSYFDEWKFKHPSPNDFRKIMEEKSGKNLSWFFDDALGSTKKIDFKIVNAKKINNQWQVNVKSKTNFKGPIPIQSIFKDSIIETRWLEFPYDQYVTLSTSNNLPFTSIEIDSKRNLPEINITNNKYKVKGVFHNLNLKPKLGTRFGVKPTKNIFIAPAIGKNYYDKLMIGGTIHNIEIPNNNFQFILTPLYSTQAKTLVGSGSVGYTYYPKRIFRSILFSVSGRMYHHNMSKLNIVQPVFSKHIKISPAIDFDFKKRFARSTISNNLLVRFVNIQERNIQYEFNNVDSLFFAKNGKFEHKNYVQGIFNHQNNRTFNPYSYSLEAVGNETFTKIGFTGNARIDYHLKKKSLYVRFFAGKYFELQSSSDPFSERNQYLNSTYVSNNDFMYDDVYLARNEQSKGLAQQISMREGGFKIRTPQYANPIGISNDWLASINLRSDIPIKLPIKIQAFIDFGTFANAGKLNSSKNKSLFDAGLELHLFKDILTIYAPLILSKDFKNYTEQIYSKNRFLNTMSFSLNLQKINFLKTAQLVNLISN